MVKIADALDISLDEFKVNKKKRSGKRSIKTIYKSIIPQKGGLYGS
jgi:hypothetical protein